ncbi:GtrA family protein [Gymnodinialimonas sp. 2305UL16-5]|uniref:GtrA family protein n=1 Tax=Gymnodinialimonas mytili TaxID=3126503 RepID=UPI0030AAD933
MRDTIRQAISFGLVGVLNTAIGFGTIVLAQTVFGLPPVVSNILGYAAGLTNSFFMNRAITFRGASRDLAAAIRFLVAFAIAYGANLAVLLGLLSVAPEAALAWQAVAMIVYTGVFFVLSKFYVFRVAP